MAQPPHNLYKMVCSKRDLDQIKAWGQKAEAMGFKAEFTDGLKFIHNKLTTDPLNWGDPQFRLRHLNLLMCQGIHSFFLPSLYAVDEQKRLVFIKGFYLLPGSKLN
jgi:hypothetical protein